jgi:hypothetical protein
MKLSNMSKHVQSHSGQRSLVHLLSCMQTSAPFAANIQPVMLERSGTFAVRGEEAGMVGEKVG